MEKYSHGCAGSLVQCQGRHTPSSALFTTEPGENSRKRSSTKVVVASAAAHVQVNAFELYGFDVLFDQKLKVWLLEVNASPSLGLRTELDREVKSQLIKDVITLVNPLPFDRLALANVLKRRKQQRTGPARKSRRQGGGLLAGTEAEEKEVLNVDLHAILKGANVRAAGEMPHELGNFERVAPCALLEHFQRMQRNSPGRPSYVIR